MLENFFLDIFANPFVCYILLMLGIYLLLFGINSPGMGMEVGGAICLGLSIVGVVIIGIDFTSIILFVVGAALFIVEAQSEGNLHGIFALGGILCIIGGGIFFLQSLTPLMEPYEITIMWVTLLTFTITLSLVFGGITLKVIESKRRKSTETFIPKEGESGIAKTDLKPEGQVVARGEIWSARCVDGYWPVVEGEKVKILKVEGVYLIVQPWDAQQS
jgi:membrane-bound serine protease (ClpP class)